MTDTSATHVARIDDDWALAADGLQWILQRRRAGGWRAVSFVSSTAMSRTQEATMAMPKTDDAEEAEDVLRLEYQLANAEHEITRLRAVNQRLEQALTAASRVLAPYARPRDPLR